MNFPSPPPPPHTHTHTRTNTPKNPTKQVISPRKCYPNVCFSNAYWCASTKRYRVEKGNCLPSNQDSREGYGGMVGMVGRILWKVWRNWIAAPGRRTQINKKKVSNHEKAWIIYLINNIFE